MQQPTPVQLVLLLAVVLILAQMRRKALALQQPNRANAFVAAQVAAVVLFLNAAARMMTQSIEAYQSSIAILAFAPIAIAAYFLVQSALKGEATRIAPEVQRQAEAFKKPSAPAQSSERHDTDPES